MILAFDTSNYTTSIAILDAHSVVVDQRYLIRVPIGSRGIRQSDGFFQHMQHLDSWLSDHLVCYQKDLTAIAVSTQPRAVSGSYMPVFRAGEIIAKQLATALQLPLICCSHQMGHLYAAIKAQRNMWPLLFFHLSGGTSEVHRIQFSDGEPTFETVAETADISFGQLVDRIGVKAQLEFPCGKEMDRLATKADRMATPTFRAGTTFNLSGYENVFTRLLSEHEHRYVFYWLFDAIADMLVDLIDYSMQQSALRRIVLAGGVAANSHIRQRLKTYAERKAIDLHFADIAMSSDNAVGVARYAHYKRSLT